MLAHACCLLGHPGGLDIIGRQEIYALLGSVHRHHGVKGEIVGQDLDIGTVAAWPLLNRVECPVADGLALFTD